MAVFKCKMCGGELNLIEGQTVCECEYCGSRQTVPSADNEKKMTLFSRANRLRLASEFDKAAGVYEALVADFPEESEAYWGLVLCRYGIEYVDDPATGKKIPTCHRSSFESIFDDEDFNQACENADTEARRVLRDEAKAIEEIRKGIIEVSGKEEPYDIFICYKETDEKGDRTLDSVLAQDIYDNLTDKGYRVFFSRITLEDKLGQEYEPYIFAALNSAKIMLAVGTDYEYYNAVWVKNEWSRFLKLMAENKEKHLIPCYKNIDAYDMPQEFAKLQAQDMGKVGAIQDLLRGIDKLIGKEKEAVKETVVVSTPSAPGVDSLLKRGYIFLEDKDWESADEYFDKVLDIVPECVEAYLGKFFAKYHCTSLDYFSDKSDTQWFNNKNIEKVLRFGNEVLKKEIEELKEKILQQNIIAKKKKIEELKPKRDRLKFITDRFIAAGWKHTIGLKADGTLLATAKPYILCNHGQCDVSGWTDIVAISAGEVHTVGLKSDGTVVATKYTGRENSNYGQCEVSDWTDIVAISTSYGHTVGLKSDGTVVATKYIGDKNYDYGEYEVSGWTDIVAISAGSVFTIGLKSDGTVVAVGANSYGKCEVSGWTDIVAISAGTSHTVGLKSDGTVVAVGENDEGQCDVSGWKLFDNFDTLEQDSRISVKRRNEKEKQKAIEKAKRNAQIKIMDGRKSKGLCPYCGGTFKGFLFKKCINCGREKDY